MNLKLTLKDRNLDKATDKIAELLAGILDKHPNAKWTKLKCYPDGNFVEVEI